MTIKGLAKFVTGVSLLTTCAAYAQQKKTYSNTIKYVDRSNMNLSIKPGDNFYLFVNGNWLLNNPVPASKTRWGSFDALREESSQRLKTLLEEATKSQQQDRKTKMIGDFYVSGMDSSAIEAAGISGIKADLDRVAGIKNTQAALAEIAMLRTLGYGAPLFRMSVAQDRKNVDAYIPQVSQGGTTLPDRDYYFKNDPRSIRIREAYKTYLQQLFYLAGEDGAMSASSADAVLRIETALAKVQYSRVEQRDPYRTYNKFDLRDLNNITPEINWNNLFVQMKVQPGDSVLVDNPAFLKTADLLIGALPINDWKSYLRWNVLKSSAPYLGAAFVDANFKFTQVLSGQKEQTPRWQRIAGLIDGSLGDMLGQLYVERFFKPEAKQRMQDLVSNLQTSFEERIKRLDWMSDATKKRGLEKLHAFTKKIAYPDKWQDYQGVAIAKNDFISNVRSANAWEYNDMVSRMGKPVDRTRWGMTPPTINAYYSPVNNEIVFPAAILQFPFFDFGADDAINYGGIGAVIGHEMTHGFDDQGRQYAASGKLEDWWTKDDADKFKLKADQVVNLYNSFTVLDTIHLNGRLTLGENLADLGGLSMAFDAFTKTKQFKDGQKIDGFTPAQRFFISWAQIWRSNSLPETQAQLILTDPHSPGMYRANGAVLNIDAWYDAFNIQAGDKMFVPKDKRTHIW